MPTTLTNGIQLPDKGSVDWYNSMQSNYNLIDTHLGDTDVHVTAEDKANWDSKQGSLSQAQLDAIAQVATNTDDIATLQSGKANASHTHSSSDITDIGDYATKQYVDNSISGLIDNAPDALDTLNELSAALNDDSNFASTVTNALAAKANSADLATVATSGSYTDLSNKPTINDSTITIQKNGSTVDTFTTNGSAKTINISVPTKTSDLTNDSNFVDTSNSAVASGITSAKVTSYDGHVADTDKHVTTADKTKWNNGVSQAYVLRYSSTAITDNSTIAYSTLDNTDNIKVSDKIIDSDGKIFSVVSIDSANETVTVGSALIDLALNANVMHLSGNETANGEKTFNDLQIICYGTQYKGARNAYILPEFSAGYSGLSITTLGFAQALKIGNFVLDANNKPGLDTSKAYIQIATGENNGVNACILESRNSTSSSLGTSANKWKSFNGVEPSSLSLPSGNANDVIDISGYLVYLDGTTNTYNAPANGWIAITMSGCSGIQAYINGLWGNQIVRPSVGAVRFLMPVVKNLTVNILIFGGAIDNARFIPCQGNV